MWRRCGCDCTNCKCPNCTSEGCSDCYKREGSSVCRPDNSYLMNQLFPQDLRDERINDYFPNLIPRPVISISKVYDGPERTVAFHYTSWCPYCKRFKPIWDKLVKDPALANIKMMPFDGDVYKFSWVTSFPTIIVYQDGHGYKYTGDMNLESVRSFILTPSFQSNGPYYNID